MAQEREISTGSSTGGTGTSDGNEPSGRKLLAKMPGSTFAAKDVTVVNLIPEPPKVRRPEFSIITCSVNDHRFEQMSGAYRMTMAGEDYEIVRISDAKSLAEGYNRGAAQSRGDILVFSHDDAAPVRPFAARLRQHLRRVDIVAGAGTDRLDGPAWFTAGPPHVFGQVLNHIPPQNPPQPAFLLSVYGVPARLVTGIVAFDGFWFAMGRQAFLRMCRENQTRGAFDEDMCDSFHMYDVDLSFRAHRAGLKVGVATDLFLMHASVGGYGDPKWKPAADKWMAQYGDRLMPHRDTGFVMTAINGNDVAVVLNAMDQFVARAAEIA